MIQAPWWGVPMIAGGFLILGGVLTFVYTYINDFRKDRREDRRRFDEKTLDSAAQIASRAREIFLLDVVNERDGREISEMLGKANALLDQMLFDSMVFTYVAPRLVRDEAQKLYDIGREVVTAPSYVQVVERQQQLVEGVRQFNDKVRQACGNRR